MDRQALPRDEPQEAAVQQGVHDIGSEVVMNKFDVMGIVGFVVFSIVTGVILHNSFEIRVQKQAEAAYQQGYKDALYKRPVSEDLEMVCAGIWIGKENERYMAKEGKK